MTGTTEVLIKFVEKYGSPEEYAGGSIAWKRDAAIFCQGWDAARQDCTCDADIDANKLHTYQCKKISGG